MASTGQGLLLLLLLLLTAHPGPLTAQHWSHGWYPGGKRASDSPQDPLPAPRLPAGNPGQTAEGLPSSALAPPEDVELWEGKTMALGPLREKQRLMQTLLQSRARAVPRRPSALQ
ncbi:progonadoliberin-2 isoform X1 [Sorex araneus]|uniref:progonadoliberin-2 isoform X1 n=1 Tax=Sorex araneus TaxID=42254 RepID=UPI0024336867|nr:progonadoliberin-2 isoform X1 [Sorex araneus]